MSVTVRNFMNLSRLRRTSSRRRHVVNNKRSLQSLTYFSPVA